MGTPTALLRGAGRRTPLVSSTGPRVNETRNELWEFVSHSYGWMHSPGHQALQRGVVDCNSKLFNCGCVTCLILRRTYGWMHSPGHQALQVLRLEQMQARARKGTARSNLQTSNSLQCTSAAPFACQRKSTFEECEAASKCAHVSTG